jgi:hypothetical protein
VHAGGGRLAIVQVVSNALAISDYDNASGSASLLQGFRALAGLREGLCGATRDDDDAVATDVLRHGNGAFQRRGFTSKHFNGSDAGSLSRLYAHYCTSHLG